MKECARDFYPTMHGQIANFFQEEVDRRFIEQINELVKRLPITRAHLAPDGELLHVAESETHWLLHRVKIVNFVRWAKKMKWDLPDELSEPH